MGPAYAYRPVASREQYTADLMEEALSASSDRSATLVAFVEHLEPAEAAELRVALAALSIIRAPLEQGIALQQFFRDPANFTYDLRARPGTGQAAILDFLDDRRGYCEQFASTMAVMARHLGIPARVNVGFTAGELADDGLSRVISAHDAHAWPELWLPGIGWVRFEPTPGSASSSPSAPSWLTPRERPANHDAAQDEADTADTGRADEDPGTGDQDILGGGAPDEPACGDLDGSCSPSLPVPEDADAQAGGGEPWHLIATLVAGVLLLMTIPAAVRVALRRRRFDVIERPETGMAVATEIAWRELRDSIIDLGHHWPEARTPRQTAESLALDAHLDESARAVLEALTASVERVRYARDWADSVETPLRETVTMLRQAVAARAGRRARLQAIWWPRSVLAAVQILLARAGSRPRAVKRFRLRGLRALTARAR